MVRVVSGGYTVGSADTAWPKARTSLSFGMNATDMNLRVEG